MSAVIARERLDCPHCSKAKRRVAAAEGAHESRDHVGQPRVGGCYSLKYC